jgi:hypothetical protein
MITARRLLVFIICFLQTSASQVASAPKGALTVAQYSKQLRSYEQRVRALSSHPARISELMRSLPKELTVRSSRGEIHVRIDFLRDGLARFFRAERKVRPQILSSLTDRLAAMRREADEYEQPSFANQGHRNKLKEILAAREFNRVNGPNALELLRARIAAWIYRQLDRLSPKIPEVSELGQIAIWVVIAMASSIMGVWLYRISRRKLADVPREIVPFFPSDKTWQAWLIDARQKALQGQWRDAIHLAFWAAVSRLETDGVWRPDRARTPREYLQAIPAANAAKAPFNSLVSRFETVWYGNRPSSEIDFAGCIRELENLGCE